MARQVEAFLGVRGGAAPTADAGGVNAAAGAIVEFVCEEDVRQAIKQGRKIVIGERTIVTPAARDLADANRIFVLHGVRS